MAHFWTSSLTPFIHVVDGKGPNLLGRDWLSNLKLTIEGLHNLSTPSALQNVLSKHATAFSDKLGELKGVKIKLHVDPSKIFQSSHSPLCTESQGRS